jgi:hypothetical protein
MPSVVRNQCVLRGLDTIGGEGVEAMIRDPSRFATASDFMSFAG